MLVLNADVVRGTGCGLDKKPIWTSSPCSEGGQEGHITHAGASSGTSDYPITCSAPSKTFKVRCCADAKIFSSGNFPTNNAPSAQQIPANTAVVGASFQQDVSPYFSDLDGDFLTFQVTGLPPNSGVNLGLTSGVLSGIPTAADANAPQPLKLTVTANDGEGGRSATSFELEVQGMLQTAPNAGAISPADIAQGVPFVIGLSAYFEGTDILTFTVIYD